MGVGNIDFPGTGIFCFIALLFIALHSKLNVFGNLVLSKSIGNIFPTAFVHCISVSHSDNSHISKFFIIIIFFIVIYDNYYSNCFGLP